MNISQNVKMRGNLCFSKITMHTVQYQLGDLTKLNIDAMNCTFRGDYNILQLV